MHLTFKNKKITGVLSVLPENEIRFSEEIAITISLKNKVSNLVKLWAMEPSEL